MHIERESLLPPPHAAGSSVEHHRVEPTVHQWSPPQEGMHHPAGAHRLNFDQGADEVHQELIVGGPRGGIARTVATHSAQTYAVRHEEQHADVQSQTSTAFFESQLPLGRGDLLGPTSPPRAVVLVDAGVAMTPLMHGFSSGGRVSGSAQRVTFEHSPSDSQHRTHHWDGSEVVPVSRTTPKVH